MKEFEIVNVPDSEKKLKTLFSHRFKNRVKLILCTEKEGVSSLRAIEEKKYNTLLTFFFQKKVKILNFFLAFVTSMTRNDSKLSKRSHMALPFSW